MTLNYQTTLLTTAETASVVFFGPFGLVFVFSLLVLVSWVLQRVIGAFPDVGSKFVLAFGIQTFLDPFLILIVDVVIRVSDLDTFFILIVDVVIWVSDVDPFLILIVDVVIRVTLTPSSYSSLTSSFG